MADKEIQQLQLAETIELIDDAPFKKPGNTEATRFNMQMLMDFVRANLSSDLGGALVAQSASFKVRNTDTVIVEGKPLYEYDAEADEATITDGRLVGKTDYPVFSTQRANEFKDEELEYFIIEGKVKIKSFELSDGEHVTININPVSNDQFEDVTGQLAEFRQQFGIFNYTINPVTGDRIASFAKVWWPSAEDVPLGWQECTDMRGLFPVAYKPGDADFGGVLGQPVGSNTVTLGINNLPKHTHPMDAEKVAAGTASIVGDARGQGSLGNYPGGAGTGIAGNDEPFKIIPKSMRGIWIEYIGV